MKMIPVKIEYEYEFPLSGPEISRLCEIASERDLNRDDAGTVVLINRVFAKYGQDVMGWLWKGVDKGLYN